MNEPVSYFKAVASLIFVLGLITMLAYVVRRFAFGGSSIPLVSRAQKRLQTVESLWLDARYRIVIVRDGDTEHTLVLGPQSAQPLHAATNATGLTHAK